MTKTAIIGLTILFAFITALSEESRILRYPNSSATGITFCHGGDVFTVPIEGGLARRITTSDGVEIYPRFSNDGSQIAFSGEYDGSREIYLIPSKGGSPERLTYSVDIPGLPERMGPDKIIMQWTSDDKIIYRSRHESWHAWVGNLYKIDGQGGLPEEMPLPSAGYASLSPDGKKIAYNRIFREYRTWKRYRGGQADDIWIYDFTTKSLENISNNPAQDIIPMWTDSKIYYISDRDKRLNLFAYDLTTKLTKKITDFKDYDIKFPSLGKNHIAFENGGYIYLMDLATEHVSKVTVQINEDWPEIRTGIEDVSDDIHSFEISPEGDYALFSARGDIFAVPADEEYSINLNESPGVHDRNPKWSPDGKWIAFVSDKSGEFEVYAIRPDGSDEVQLTDDGASYRYQLYWSPDSRNILLSGKDMRLYYINLATKRTTEVTRSDEWEITDFKWSPDSKWIAYSDYNDALMSQIYVYNLETKETKVVTDELFNCTNPVFSVGGNYLFFVSDRTLETTIGAFEWNYSFSNIAKIYGITLNKDGKSPFAFKADLKSPKKSDDVEPISIDFEGIQDRIFEFPVEAAIYGSLYAAKDHKLYYVKNKTGGKPGFYVFDGKEKKEEKVGDFAAYEISSDSKKIIFSENKNYYISKLDDKVSAEDKDKVNTGEMKVMLDRKAEWAQIFDEAWRQMRDFFYDPNMHGVDWPGMKAKYEPLVEHAHHRTDLTYVVGEMISELNVGHAYTGGGEQPDVEDIAVGLLGAEFELDKVSGYYKITRILEGRNWDEKTRSPLTEPGIDINEGDFLISIDGKELNRQLTPFEALLNKADRYVKVIVNSSPKKEGAKEYNIKTTKNETGLRYLNWVENNRRKVDEATNGKVRYIHIPDMGVDNGLREFVKYFYPQLRKEALIIDDRYNGGGNVSPMIIERLRRELAIAKHARNQNIIMTTPNAVMTGPMVCLINELSASDGDLFPYQFKLYNLGKLIGKRTWGGVIGIRGSLPFLDGGYLYKPEFANFGADGTWVLEGEGMSPDIEVDNHPAKLIDGVDEQLNKAIEVILEEIKTNEKRQIPKMPPFPAKK